MPIKTSATGDVAYLLSYQPFKLPNQEELGDINDMISIDVKATENVTLLNYYIGAESTYTFSVELKNITDNCILEVEVNVPTSALTSTEAKTPESNANATEKIISFVLDPNQTKKISMALDKDILNKQPLDDIDFNVPITIKNRKNGTIVTKNINATKLESKNLPLTIDIS